MQLPIRPRLRAHFCRCAMLPLAAITALTCASSAHAQEAHTGNSISPALRYAASLLSVGGYYFTGASATRTLGTPKFFGDSQLFVRPKNYGAVTLTGGLEIMSANDHFLPFQGGNEFNLIGPAFRVSTQRTVGKLRPFVTGGLFAGRVRSLSGNFDRTNFTPSLSVGVEYPFNRYLTLYGSYRVSQEIHSVNTDGVSVGLRVF